MRFEAQLAKDSRYYSRHTQARRTYVYVASNSDCLGTSCKHSRSKSFVGRVDVSQQAVGLFQMEVEYI
jgi:hypothetical protein